jgi:hypothetical protein
MFGDAMGVSADGSAPQWQSNDPRTHRWIHFRERTQSDWPDDSLKAVRIEVAGVPKAPFRFAITEHRRIRSRADREILVCCTEEGRRTIPLPGHGIIARTVRTGLVPVDRAMLAVRVHFELTTRNRQSIEPSAQRAHIPAGLEAPRGHSPTHRQRLGNRQLARNCPSRAVERSESEAGLFPRQCRFCLPLEKTEGHRVSLELQGVADTGKVAGGQRAFERGVHGLEVRLVFASKVRQSPGVGLGPKSLFHRALIDFACLDLSDGRLDSLEGGVGGFQGCICRFQRSGYVLLDGLDRTVLDGRIQAHEVLVHVTSDRGLSPTRIG